MAARSQFCNQPADFTSLEVIIILAVTRTLKNTMLGNASATFNLSPNTQVVCFTKPNELRCVEPFAQQIGSIVTPKLFVTPHKRKPRRQTRVVAAAYRLPLIQVPVNQFRYVSTGLSPALTPGLKDSLRQVVTGIAMIRAALDNLRKFINGPLQHLVRILPWVTPSGTKWKPHLAVGVQPFTTIHG